MRKVKLPGVISLRKLLPICAMPKGILALVLLLFLSLWGLCQTNEENEKEAGYLSFQTGFIVDGYNSL